MTRLSQCASSRKCAGSNSSSRTMVLRSTQPLTETSTRNIIWGSKGGWCVGLTTLPPSCADCFETWEPHSPGILKGCPGLYRDCFIFTHTSEIWVLADIFPKLHDLIQQTKLISICKILKRSCAVFTLSLLRVFIVEDHTNNQRDATFYALYG